MKNLSISVDEELHLKVKLHAMRKGMSLKEYILSLIQKDLETKKE